MSTAPLKSDAPASLRLTPAYAEALRLLREKKGLQAGLREVDRMLRDLEIVAVGVISLARYDIDHDYLDNSSNGLPGQN